MKKFFKILSLSLVIAIVSTIIVSVGQPIVAAFAHDFPHDLRDWGTEDWEKFYEYQNRYYYENNPYDSRQNNYIGYYNGHAVYWNGNHYYYIGDDGCQYYCDDYYRQPYQSYQQPYQQQPQYSNTNYGNNYYNGVINAYDAGSEAQAQILAKIIHLYGHGVASQTAQACVGWAVMNSVDASGGGVDIGAVAPNFHYNSSEATTDDFGRDLMPLARDVIYRWKAGRSGMANNGRVLPSGYCWVWSTGSTVYFRNTPNESGAVWNYSYTSPYGS